MTSPQIYSSPTAEEKFGPDPETPDDFSFHETNEVTRPRSPENTARRPPDIRPFLHHRRRSRSAATRNETLFIFAGANKPRRPTALLISGLSSGARSNVLPKFPSLVSLSPASTSTRIKRRGFVKNIATHPAHNPSNCFLIGDRGDLLILLIMKKKLCAVRKGKGRGMKEIFVLKRFRRAGLSVERTDKSISTRREIKICHSR